MPFKGHARNMVSSYARYLGLDSQEITEQFLSEYHDYENRQLRRGTSASFSAGAAAINPASMDYGIEEPPAVSSRGFKQVERQGNRSMWDRPIPSSDLNRGYDSRSASAQRLATAASRRRARSLGTGSSKEHRGVSGNTSYEPRPSLPMRIFGALAGSRIVLVIVLIVELAVLLGIWTVVSNSCRQQQDEIIPVNTGNVVDLDAPENPDGTEGEGTEEPAAPDPDSLPFELAVEPVAGTTPWTEVTVDGELVCAELLSERKAWQVTDDCVVTTAQPDNLSVGRNGIEVELTVDTSTGLASAQLEVKESQQGQGAGGEGAGEGEGGGTGAGEGEGGAGEGASGSDGQATTGD
jgi:cytoskeletal protein RodZ